MTFTTDFVLKYNTTLDDQEKSIFYDAVRTQVGVANPQTTTDPIPTFEETAKNVRRFSKLIDDNTFLCSFTKEEMKTISALIGMVGLEIGLEYEELKKNPLAEFASTLSSETKYYSIDKVKHQIQKAAALYNGKYTCKRSFKFMNTPVFFEFSF